MPKSRNRRGLTKCSKSPPSSRRRRSDESSSSESTIPTPKRRREPSCSKREKRAHASSEDDTDGKFSRIIREEAGKLLNERRLRELARTVIEQDELLRHGLDKQSELGKNSVEEGTYSSCASNREISREPEGHEIEIYRPWKPLEREAIERIERINIGDSGYQENGVAIDRVLDTIQEVQRLTGENIKTQQLMLEVELRRLQNENEKLKQSQVESKQRTWSDFTKFIIGKLLDILCVWNCGIGLPWVAAFILGFHACVELFHHIFKRKKIPNKDEAKVKLIEFQKIPDKDEAKVKRCYICLEDATEDNQVFPLPCQHTFHIKCLNQWIKPYSTCPICTKGVIIENDDDAVKVKKFDGDESDDDGDESDDGINVRKINEAVKNFILG